MLNFSLEKLLGSIFSVAVGNPSLANAAGTRNGAAIDRATPGGVRYAGMSVVAECGAATGKPSAQTLDAKVQDSADGSTGWADYIPPGESTVAAVPQLAADGAISKVDVDLSGAKRYVRIVETVALTGGTSPKLPASEVVVLYGGDRT